MPKEPTPELQEQIHDWVTDEENLARIYSIVTAILEEKKEKRKKNKENPPN